jgi:hypothetical protein
MKTKLKAILFTLVVTSILISGCGPGQVFGPTPTPLPTSTPIPSSTPVPTITPKPTATNTSTPEPTATATRVPICPVGQTAKGTIDDIIPGYLDITEVSSTIEGTKLTVVIHVRDLPEQITINQKDLPKGGTEIAWGVAVDVDNDPDTGGRSFLSGTGYGYEAFLHTFHFKTAGSEQTGPINRIFQGDTNVWAPIESGGMKSIGPGKMTVDTEQKTITLTANIPKITPKSVLSFYSFFIDAKKLDEPYIDEVCQR